MANVRYDPLHMEPRPRRYHKIFCFTCKEDVAAKRLLRIKHMNHTVEYLDEKGLIDE